MAVPLLPSIWFKRRALAVRALGRGVMEGQAEETGGRVGILGWD